MPVSRKRVWGIVVLGVAALTGSAAVGYQVGVNGTPAKSEISQARAAAARSAEERSFQSAHALGYDRGLEIGRESGLRSGTDAGSRDGKVEAQKRLVDVAAARQAEADRQAEAARQAESARQAAARPAPAPTGCHVPLFTDGACPTPEQIQRENDAEGLCGGGTEAGRAEAARRGIQC